MHIKTKTNIEPQQTMGGMNNNITTASDWTAAPATGGA